jgi:glyoxylase-like metal-dependent hydrolase (beta-lactamase superfamily II)
MAEAPRAKRSKKKESTMVRSHPLLVAGLALVVPLLAACAASHHPTRPSELGRAASSDALLAVIDRPGPVEVETVEAAGWVVARSGLLNLDHPKARAAGLEDGDEPIGIYFHVLRHPRHGLFIIDSGVESGFRDPDGNERVGWLLARAMRTDDLDIHTTTAEWLARQDQPLAGVFLTHLHLDHVMGLPDVPPDTPIYAGPGEPAASRFLHVFTRGTIDAMLERSGPVREWPFESDADGRLAGVVDVFGDGSVWALHVPGHTPGSTAYLVRTPTGPVLYVGDASHTRWGWENGVEPGTFSLDQPRSAESLAALRALVEAHPRIEVHLGHQDRDAGACAHSGSTPRSAGTC